MAAKKRNPYFFIIHVILLLVVLIGFGPSFFLRPLSDQAALPVHLVLHGLCCTAWFVVVVVQAYWVEKRKLARHIQLGPYFSLISPAVLLTGLWVIYYKIDHYYQLLATPSQLDAEQAAFQSMIIWSDVLVLFFFLAIVYLAYRFRKKIEFHKRFILFASFMIIPQAFVRIGKFSWLQLGDDPAASGSIYAVIGPVLILISLVIYDLRTSKKVHRASWIAIGWYVALLVCAFLIMRSGIGVAALEWMRWETT